MADLNARYSCISAAQTIPRTTPHDECGPLAVWPPPTLTYWSRRLFFQLTTYSPLLNCKSYFIKKFIQVINKSSIWPSTYFDLANIPGEPTTLATQVNILQESGKRSSRVAAKRPTPLRSSSRTPTKAMTCQAPQRFDSSSITRS